MKTYDPKCWDLALAFLQDLPMSDVTRDGWAHRLASEIQETVEQTLKDFTEGSGEDEDVFA